MLILIGGGVRSGKSAFALGLARRLGTRRTYIATAEAGDDEMAGRIARHAQERGADFKTVEKGAKDKLDLDFYATKGPDGWKIDKTVIHKVNGKPRYTYNDKNEMVPVTD